MGSEADVHVVEYTGHPQPMAQALARPSLVDGIDVPAEAAGRPGSVQLDAAAGEARAAAQAFDSSRAMSVAARQHFRRRG